MIRHLALLGPFLAASACNESPDFVPNDDEDSGLIDEDEDGFFSNEDCNDLDPDVYPGAPELCDDGRITDCNRKNEDNTVTVRNTGFDDLQEALDFANAGDDVVICPGTYEGIFTGPVPVNMRSTAGPFETTLSSSNVQAARTTLTVRAGTTITGLTIRDGNADIGGGVMVADPKGGTLEIDTCIITENTAFDGAGLFAPPDLQVTLRSTSIDRNTAHASGGGVYLSPGALLRLESDSEIVHNTARSGGGVALQAARLEGGVVSENNAVDTPLPEGVESSRTLRSPGGSGILGLSRSTVEATTVRENHSHGTAGGAVMVLNGDELTLTDVRVGANVTDDAGGGLEVRGGLIRMQGTTEVFENISSTDKGSGALVENGSLSGGVIRDHKDGGGILISDGSISGTELRDNKNTHEGGCIEARGVVSLTGVTITSCEASTGGGIYYQREGSGGEQKLTMVGGTVRRNRSEVGGGIFGESVSLTNTTVSENQAGRGGGLYIVRQLVLQEATITDNESILAGRSAGGGIFYQPRTGEGYPAIPISVVGSDFGVRGGPDDNSPDDITFVGSTKVWTYDNYNAKVSFDCLPDTGCEDIGEDKGPPPPSP